MLVLALGVVASPYSSSAASLSQTTVSIQINITDLGFEPENVTIVAGQSVHWTNESSQMHTVTAKGGHFDSGNLPTGAGFSIALAVPGVHTYSSLRDPDFEAQIRVVLEGLSAPANELANDHIPAITFPLRPDGDLSPHPDYGFLASRTRIMLGFKDDATVAEANAAMQSANVVIIGGLTNVEVLLVEAEDTPDFSGLNTAIDALRGDPAVDFAAMSREVAVHEIPQPAEKDLFEAPNDEAPTDWRFDQSEIGLSKLGTGGNWGTEASRLPQMWNFREEVVTRGNYESIRTAVIDAGFEKHPDLDANLTIETLCKPTPDGPKCTNQNVDRHGPHVSGIIGATYDNDSFTEPGRSIGVSGANPVARMSGISFGFQIGSNTHAETLESIELVLDKVSGLRVINLSFAPVAPTATAWWQSKGALKTYGPGDDDDSSVAKDFCTFNNEDGWLKDMNSYAGIAKNIAVYASILGVLIVQSAGNESNDLCIGSIVNAPDCVDEKIYAENMAGFARASARWHEPFLNALPNPIVAVENIDIDRKRDISSNLDGDISAPGEKILSTLLNETYGTLSGTSMSAPQVSGILGFILAFTASTGDPLGNMVDAKQRLLDWAVSDTTDDASARVDAFATIMSIPGAAKVLVDVNGMSKDGNRRVILGPPDPANTGGVELGMDNASSDEVDPTTGRFFRTHPDGIINMRDFRRWRDAFLQSCAGVPVGLGNCAEVDNIFLNGGEFNTKKDLIFDRCVEQGTDIDGCPIPEDKFSRFDFNGDGKISLVDKAKVPLNFDGTVVTDPNNANMMTDLEVLVSQWDPDPNKTEGWTATDLSTDFLVNSGDLEIHALDLFVEGATEVFVNITNDDTGETYPTRKIPSGDFIIYTIPAGDKHSIEASAIVDGNTIEARLLTNVRLPAAGLDSRINLCIRKLELFASPLSLIANGKDEAEIRARFQACDTETLEDAVIDFTVSPTGEGHGSVKFSTMGVESNGTALNIFTAGSEVAEYEITGVATLQNGKQAEGKVTIDVTSSAGIAYKFEQTVLEFSEQGSSRWPVVDLSDPAVNEGFNAVCNPASVFGIVTLPDGQPKAGAKVSFVGIDGEPSTTENDGIFGLSVAFINGVSPIQLTLRLTSAFAGQDKQDRVITVHCNALIGLHFFESPPPVTTIEGKVTDATTGNPIPGVLIGSQFGGSATTDIFGEYVLNDVPLGSDGSDRFWQVTVVPSNYPSTFKSVVVAFSKTARVDFELGIGDCDDDITRIYTFPDGVADAIFLFGGLKEGGKLILQELIQSGVVVKSWGVDPLPSPPAPPLDSGFISALQEQLIPGIASAWRNCVDYFGFETTIAPVLAREGTLTDTASGLLVTELVTTSAVSGLWETRLGDSSEVLGNAPTDVMAGQVTMKVAPDEVSRYTDYPLSNGTSIESTSDGMLVHGLSEVAELEYLYDSSFTITEWTSVPQAVGSIISGISFGAVPQGLGVRGPGTHRPQLMFVPRGDGSALRYSNDMSQPLQLNSDDNGGFVNYEYCEVVVRDYQTQPAYFSNNDVTPPGAQLWKRNTTFQPPSGLFQGSYLHEYPTPVGPGHYRIKYAFSATITEGGIIPNFNVPDCSESDNLVADFSTTPPHVEGQVVFFTDESTSQGNSIIAWLWDFGDNSDTSAEKNPAHFYKDNGDYEVQLRVIDAKGDTDAITKIVTVDNAPPQGEIDNAAAHEGESVDLVVRLADPGELDQAELELKIQSSNPDFQTIQDTRPAGIHPFSILGLPVGDYPLTLTITDKDGGIGNDDAQVIVVGSGDPLPPTPPTPEPPPLVTCDPAVTLDGQETLFLDLLNAYRVQAGVAPLEASPALTKVALRHALDMAANSFTEHIGSDGSDPIQRALEEGYPSDNVGENLASGLDSAANVLAGWKASPGHNQNMLDPLWVAIGISRELDTTSYWATSFGEVIDCPTALLNSEEESTTILASASFTDRESGSSSNLSERAIVLSSRNDREATRAARVVDTRPTRISIPVTEAPVLQLPQIVPLLPFLPTTALVISNLNPEAEDIVTFTNVSRDAAGQPISASLRTGDSGGLINLGPGESRQHIYTADGTFTVSLLSSDADGQFLSLERDIEVSAPPPPQLPDPDFNMTISPDAQVIHPDDKLDPASFVIALASIGDFNSPVTLSIIGLPAGLTGVFSPDVVTPSGTSILTLTATDDSLSGLFNFDIVAEGGGITQMTASSVSLSFGLIPICTGTFEGTVYDADTLLPIPGAFFTGIPFVKTDENGHYIVTNLSLGFNNTPRSKGLTTFITGYWPAVGSGVAECGKVDDDVDIFATKIKFGAVKGRVVVGEPDLLDIDPNVFVIPTDIPLEDVAVKISGNGTLTDAGGFYQFNQLPLNQNNAPRNDTVGTEKDGYWRGDSQKIVREADKTTEVPLITMVPICTSDLRVRLTYGDTKEPAAFIRVDIKHPNSGTFRPFTDANGEISLDNLRLGFFNFLTELRLIVSASAVPGYNSLDEFFDFKLCDDVVSEEFELVPRVENFGALEGHVVDENGDPVEGVSVTFISGFVWSATTDANGYYLIEDVSLGFDLQTSKSGTARAGSADYWRSDQTSVTLQNGQTAIADFEVLKKRYGKIKGTVRDVATGEPIEGAEFSTSIFFTSLPGAGPTGPDGTFESDPLGLGFRNIPITKGFDVVATGYWNGRGSTVIHADETETVDVDLIPVCQGATIIGTVFDASTLLPLEGASVNAFAGAAPGGNATDKTDVNGNFLLTKLTVSNENSPKNVTVQVFKSGFFTQTKSVTIFCNASIFAGFGDDSTSVGTIEGTVTDLTTGLPMPDVFIGSEFGAKTTTDSLGHYSLTDVPLNPDNSDRDWKVTAALDGFTSQTKQATVMANETTILNFEFGGGIKLFDLNRLDDPLEVQETSVLNVEITATSTDPVILTIQGLPPFASFTDNGDGTGMLTLTPGFDDSGDYLKVQLAATDGTFFDSQLFTIRVINLNRLPIANANGPYVVDEGRFITLDATGSSDPDGGGLFYQWDLNENGSFIDTLEKQSLLFLEDGVFEIVLRVNDGLDFAFDTTTLTVNELPPRAGISVPRFKSEGTFVVINDGSSAYPDEIISWDWEVSGIGTSTEQNPSFFFEDDDDYKVKLTVVDDDGSTASRSSTIVILNALPVVEAGENQTTSEGDLVELDPATFTDLGILDTHQATIDWGDGSSEEDGTVIEGGGSGTVSGSHVYTSEGSYTVQVCVIDNDDDFERPICDTFVVTVAPGNDPPVLSPIGNQVMNEGATLNVSVTATDPESDPIALMASNLPLFAAFTDNGDGTGTLSLAPGFDDAGVYSDVKITASDGGSTNTETLTITVHDVNRLPIADAGGPYIANEGDTIALNASGSFDPDGDNLTYEWEFEGQSFFDVSVDVTKDDDFSGNATLTVDDGSPVSDIVGVIFNNVAPKVDIGPDVNLLIGLTTPNPGLVLSRIGTFEDPGADVWAATVDYGDGAGAQPLDLNLDKSFALNHEYVDTGLFTIVVVVSDEDGGVGIDTAQISLIEPIGGIAVDKTPDNQTVPVGGTADFSITVTNTSSVSLSAVIVTDSRAPDCSNFIGVMSAGASTSYECSQQGVVANFYSLAVATGLAGFTGVIGLDSATVEIATPGIQIEKTPDEQEVANGGTAEFTIKLTNTGDTTLTKLVVSDTLTPDCARTIGQLADLGAGETTRLC